MLPKPNLELLFVTSRVVTAIYRIVSTTILLGYIARRMREGKRISRTSRRLD
jgi:hypothetical protein